MYTNGEYRVLFSDYATRHFLKDFEKKYKGAWTITRKAIVGQLKNVDMLIDSGRTNPPIHYSDDRKKYILKHEFAVAGTKKSPKSSGCRLIALVDTSQRMVQILLIYHKSHVAKNMGETAWWERIVKTEFGTVRVE